VVDFNGQDLAALRESQVNRVRAGSIGFIFQTFNLIPTLTAQENVETALVPLGVGASERRSSAARALADVGLSDRARHLPSELSDEPTGNLDESTRDEIISLLDDMWRSRGLTLVLVTHDSTIAGRAQRIGLMRNGQLDIKQDTRHGAS
jgi:putative ABC transport system ATP-binding protein